MKKFFNKDFLKVISFNKKQAKIILDGSKIIAKYGGPDSKQAFNIVTHYTNIVMNILSDEQIGVLKEYADGNLSALIFEGLEFHNDEIFPDVLSNIEILEQDSVILELASRSQILLSLAKNYAFAYDIDNNGKIMRLVANFKGGGKIKLPKEDNESKIKLTSHHGVALGAHTEGPYHSTFFDIDGHSPAPSSLILTARWNIKNEYTSIIPVSYILDHLSVESITGLTLPFFCFNRSDSFADGKGEDVFNVPVLSVDRNKGMAFKFNIFRIKLSPNAPEISRKALEELIKVINMIASPIQINLQPSRAILINNYNTIHYRDIVIDNRRLLIRLFGYDSRVSAIRISENPLLVQG